MNVLAKVKDTTITDVDLDRIISKYPPEKRGYFETEHGRQQLLEQKTSFMLFGFHAKEMGIDKSAEYLKDMEDISNQLLTKLVMEKVFEDIEVDEKDALAVYENNKEQFCDEGSVEASHILVEEQNLAKEIYDKIQKKEITFSDAAQKYSICPSKAKGGSLGIIQKGSMVPAFEKVAFTMEKGTFSEPVESQYGFHLIYISDIKPSKQLEFADVKKMITEQIKAQKQQQIYDETLGSLKQKYDYEICSQ